MQIVLYFSHLTNIYFSLQFAQTLTVLMLGGVIPPSVDPMHVPALQYIQESSVKVISLNLGPRLFVFFVWRQREGQSKIVPIQKRKNWV